MSLMSLTRTARKRWVCRVAGTRSWALRVVLAATALALVLGAASLTSAKPPVKQKQLVYGLSPWTGKEFGSTFAPRTEDTIYLLAGTDNIVNVLETEVYYWPITKEYMSDWFGYKKDLGAKLEILKGNKAVKTLDRVDYVYAYPNGYFGGNTQLVSGDGAKAEFDQYKKATDDYWESTLKFRDAQAEYQERISALVNELAKTKKEIKVEDLPAPPEEPEPPKLYVTEPEKAFVVNLPAGHYSVRLLDNQGTTVKASEKKLVVFEERRKGVSYNVIPESKWTYPVTSGDPSQLLYLGGKTTFYISGSHAKEFNQLQYTKMTNLHEPLAGKGMSSGWMWVEGLEVEGAKLELTRNGKAPITIERKPYYVKQVPGYSLGYDVVEFDPKDPEMQGRQPTFEAFKVVAEARKGYEFRLQDAQGKLVAGSEREIRSIGGGPVWPIYAMPFFPLVIGFIVLGWRRSLSPGRRRKKPAVSAQA